MDKTELKHCANATWAQFQFICCAYHSALPLRPSSNDSSQEIRLWECKATSTINCHLFCWSKHKETPLFLLRGCIFYFYFAAVKTWHQHNSSLLKGCRISCAQISTTTLNPFQGGERARGRGRGGAIGLSLQNAEPWNRKLALWKSQRKTAQKMAEMFWLRPVKYPTPECCTQSFEGTDVFRTSRRRFNSLESRSANMSTYSPISKLSAKQT